MKNRTGIDFSEHQHRVEIFKNDNGNEIRIDHLQKGNSRMDYIQFINTDEILSVTGDFGNWIFCRPFIPTPNGYVSDSYWIEKLQISSEQHFIRLDFESIQKEIEELIDHGLEDYGYEDEQLEKAKEWFGELLDESDDEIDFLSKAYRDYYKPDFIDDEMIPYYKEVPVWLKIVFDGFEEICERLKNKEK